MINKNIKEAAIEVYKEEGTSAVITFLKKREVEENDIADFLYEHCEATGCPTKELNGTPMNNEMSETSGVTMGDLFNDAIEIHPSERIDWCCDCQKEHGYECPLEDKLPEKKPNFIKRLFGLE